MGIEDVEKRLIQHISAANRDRRSELERFRRELMGTLEMAIQPNRKTVSTVSESSGSGLPFKNAKTSTNLTPMKNPSKTILILKDERASSLPLKKIDAASLLPEAPIAGRMDEARLAQVLRGAVQDVLDSRQFVGKGGQVSHYNENPTVRNIEHISFII